MMKKFLSFYITFQIGLILTAFYANVAQPRQNPSKLPKSCKFEETGEVFSKRHYFSSKEAEGLVGKKVKNIKCGKIKCPIGFENCSFVEIGEVGKIIGLQPRDGISGYLMVIEWNGHGENYRFSTSEKNPDRLVSYVGNDGSYQFID